MIKYINKQYGVTLLELLATIAISSIFITIIFSVITTTFNQNDKTLSHINLRQEANLIITDIRNKHQDTVKICNDEFLNYNNTEKFGSFDIGIDPLSLEDGCSSSNKDLGVKLTLTDKENNEYKIDTIIEAKTIVRGPNPNPESNTAFYDFLVNENIFLYGSELDVSGSSPVNGTDKNLGTILINNDNNKDLLFEGNNKISLQNIYINKKNNNIKFISSTKLGSENITKLVRIEGDVYLENGDSEINGETVYIDGHVISNGKINATKVTITGDVLLKNGGARINADTVIIDGNVTFESDAKINAKKIIITGDVIFQNWWSQIIANEIEIIGNIRYYGNSTVNIKGTLKDIENLNEGSVPPNLSITSPKLYEENWYDSNGYQNRSSGKLMSGSRIFSEGNFTASDWHGNTNNVVIISTGDIDIRNFGGSEFTGILFAPNGKVTFNGSSFKGVVLAKNGFFTKSNPSVTFNNVSSFIKDPEPIPFK